MIQSKNSRSISDRPKLTLQIRDNGSPVFPTAEIWLQQYDDSLAKGYRPWPPVTRQEFLIAERHEILALYPQWLPGRQGLQMLGLPDHFGREVESFNDRFGERLAQTIAADAELRSALRALLSERASR